MFLHFSEFRIFSQKIAVTVMENIVYSSFVGFGWAVTEMINLLSLPLDIFAKSASCPCANELLAFLQLRLQPRQTELIEAHLNQCDFCRAELHLLERFPCEPEAVAVAELPASLRVLAESILCKPPADQPHPLHESRRAPNH